MIFLLITFLERKSRNQTFTVYFNQTNLYKPYLNYLTKNIQTMSTKLAK